MVAVISSGSKMCIVGSSYVTTLRTCHTLQIDLRFVSHARKALYVHYCIGITIRWLLRFFGENVVFCMQDIVGL